MSTQPPTASLRSRIVERVVAGQNPLHQWRANAFGLNKLRGRQPTLELYYEAGDPHSHLAAQMLPKLRERMSIPIVVYVVGETEAVLYPEREKQRQFALVDASRIAPAWGLNFSSSRQLPSEKSRLQASAELLATANLDEFLQCEQSLIPALFSGEAISAERTLDSAKLAHNNQRREWLGHYLPGMWQFAGRWYWGLDRLQHLCRDLEQAGFWTGDDLPGFDAGKALLDPAPSTACELEFFFSFRSPYSYLAAEAVAQRAENLPVPLRIRPVLPMAMRGMKIPSRKKLYIARDAKREATRMGLPFGRIADPLGSAAERCLTLFTLLDDPKQQLDFLLSNGRAVWTQGIDVANDDGLRFVWERSGLDWAIAKDKLAQGMDLQLAEANRQALFDAGCWGVPSFRLGDFVTWGNDRLWMIDELLKRKKQEGAT